MNAPEKPTAPDQAGTINREWVRSLVDGPIADARSVVGAITGLSEYASHQLDGEPNHHDAKAMDAIFTAIAIMAGNVNGILEKMDSLMHELALSDADE